MRATELLFNSCSQHKAVGGKKTVRCLSALAGASSARVLNLLALGIKNAEDPEHQLSPLLKSKALNSSIIIKHRLRSDEADLFAATRVLATKIVIPFEKTDLRAGGRSFFIGQKGYEALLREVGNYGDEQQLKYDTDVLRLLDGVPSLDPFLLREHLRGNAFNPASSYFEIADADQRRMNDYAAAEVSRLTALAGGGSGPGNRSTGRMVTALLSSEVDEKLEPLRLTLALQPDEFCEGVFSWRGFIYYKWCLEEFWPNLIKALQGIRSISPMGKVTSEEKTLIDKCKTLIIQGAQHNSQEVRGILGIYDNAYATLIEKQNPKLFREFLLSAPNLFLDIGEKMGAMSHITSFWQYRFPVGAPRAVDVEELVAIFQDFTKGFGFKLSDAA